MIPRKYHWSLFTTFDEQFMPRERILSITCEKIVTEFVLSCKMGLYIVKIIEIFKWTHLLLPKKVRMDYYSTPLSY